MSGSPATRVGHQGLFAERLDADTQADPQAAGGTVAWHNRQRTLHSEYGRFLQQDPHATGVTVPQILWWHSGDEPIESASSGRVQPSMMAMLLPNQYQYVLSHPGGLVDPTGGFPVDPRQAARIPGPGEVAMRGARAAGRGATSAFDRIGSAFMEAESKAGRPMRSSSNRANRGLAPGLNMLQQVGRATGATVAAMALDGSLIGNDAYMRTIGGVGLSSGLTVAGGLTDVMTNSPFASVYGGLASITIGFASSGRWHWTSAAGWGNTFSFASEFTLAHSKVNAVTPFVAGAVMGVSFYSGAIEYAAESAFDWWK